MWEGFELSGENNHQLYIPRQFAHGFMTLTSDVIFSYKCDNFYDKSSEKGIIWNDPTVNIQWPLDVTPVLSDKDKILGTFIDYKNNL
jgi:dTDP-4-dehydrorhamnose 3,5-epimerase